MKYVSEKYRVLAGGIILNVSVGFFCGPWLKDPFSIYSYDAISWPLKLVAMGMSIYIGHFCLRKVGPRITCLSAGLMSSITVLPMSYDKTGEQLALVMPMAFIQGYCYGVVYGVTLGVISEWFPDRRGLICGILTSAMPFSWIIFSKAQYDLRSSLPENHSNDYHISYIIQSFEHIFLLIIGVILIYQYKLEPSEPTEESSLLEDGHQPADLQGISSITVDLNWRALWKETRFWNLWITYCLLTSCFVMNMTFKFDQKSLWPLPFIKTEVTHKMIAFVFGVILWGAIIDKVKYKIVMPAVSFTVTALFGLSFIFYVAEARLSYHVPCQVLSVLISLVSSSIFSVFPYLCAKVFGTTNFIGNYGLLFTAWAAVAVALLVLIFRIPPMFGIFGLFLSLFALIATLMFKEQRQDALLDLRNILIVNSRTHTDESHHG